MLWWVWLRWTRRRRPRIPGPILLQLVCACVIGADFGVVGPRAYEEDEWPTFATVHNGQKLQFSFVKRSSRCRVPNINQETAEGSAFEPGQTLTTYRSGKFLGMDARDAREIFFATYFVCDRTTSLKKSPLNELPAVAVGDALEILTWSPTF